MEHKIFSIYDQKAAAYLPPFTLPRTEMAMRTFADCVNSKDHAFGQHPADYTLCELGLYDDSSAIITPHGVHIVVGTGIEFIKTETQLKEIPDGFQQSDGDDSPILPSPIGRNSS